MYRQRYPDDPGMHNPSSDNNTRVTYHDNPGFCERVQKSLFGIVIGLLLILVSSCLLFWNEGRAVQTAKSLDEGLNVVVPLGTTDVAFDNNNGRLVFLQGQLQADKPAWDPVYKLSISAVRLRRTVEMYQWVEHETRREVNEGDRTREDTEYSYSTEWREDLVRSSSFYSTVGHDNPSEMPATTVVITVGSVHVGAFFLSDGLVSQISDFREITPDSGVVPGDTTLQYHRGFYFNSANPSNPQVGDIRVKFESAGQTANSHLGPATVVSIIAQQRHNRLEPYQTATGPELEMLHSGLVSATEIFARAHSQNTMLTWAIRSGGWLLMFVAFSCLTSIVTTLVDWIPVVRELVSMGMTTMNVAFSISLSLTIIALGWIRYRPLLGFSILVMAVAPFLFTKLRYMFSPPHISKHRAV